MSKQNDEKRSLVIKYNDGTEDRELKIGKAQVVHVPNEFIYFDKMPDGRWRLTFSGAVVPNFSVIDAFVIERMNPDEPTS